MKRIVILWLCSLTVLLTAACSSQKQEKKVTIITPTPTPKVNTIIEPSNTPVAVEENNIEAFEPDRIAEKYTLRERLKKDYVDSVNSFSINLSNILLRDSKNNTAISPISIQMALSLAAAGADGTTGEELLKALSLQNTDIAYRLEQNEVLYFLLDMEDRISKLMLANSLWLGESTSFQKEYLKKAQAYYYAELYEIDFADPATADKMSNWVWEHTGQLLKPELQPDPEQVLSLINAIYYKDEWIDDFDQKETITGPFHLEDGSDVECEYMRQTHNPYGYMKGDNYISTSLGLKGNAEMHFILPEEGVSIAELLSDPEVLKEALFSEEQQYAKINFEIPKFSFGSKYELKELLKKLGIVEAFGPQADFSGIAAVDLLYISKIEHQAHIGIDENGVEAAAFTQIAYMGAAAPVDDKVVDFKLDRPFLFAIVKEDVILFIGAVYNPMK
jgi:serpin B